MRTAVVLMLLLPHALALVAPMSAAAGMRARVKFTLHEGTTAAVLRADGVTLTARVVSDAVPCPDAVDAGKLCLDVDMPPSPDPAHVFHVTLHESNALTTDVMVTEILVPSQATTDSRWFVAAAEASPTPDATPTVKPGSCARRCGQAALPQCFCDAKCATLGDCCADAIAVCLAPTPTATPEKCGRTPAQVREVQLFYTDGSTVRLLVPSRTATPLPTPTPGA